MRRRRITHTGLISVYPDQRQLLAPAYRPVTSIHRVQLAVSGHVECLLCPYRSDSSQDRNRWQVLTPVQSHLIRRGCWILMHCQDLLSLCLLLFLLSKKISYLPDAPLSPWDSCSISQLSWRTMYTY